MPGTNSSHTPVLPSARIGCAQPVQPSKSPVTRTPCAVGRPHREAGAGDRAGRGVVGAHVRAEHVPQALVAALADQVQVDLAERGQPAVRVVDDRRRARRSARPAGSPAAGPGTTPENRPASWTLTSGCAVAPPSLHDVHLVGVRAQHPDDGAVGVRVRAEHRVRVVVGAAEQAVDRRLVRRAGVDRARAPPASTADRPAAGPGSTAAGAAGPARRRAAADAPGDPRGTRGRGRPPRVRAVHQAPDRGQRDRGPGRAVAGLVDRPRRRPCPARRRAAARLGRAGRARAHRVAVAERARLRVAHSSARRQLRVGRGVARTSSCVEGGVVERAEHAGDVAQRASRARRAR